MCEVFYIANRFRLCTITKFEIDLFKPRADVNVDSAFRTACRDLSIKEGLAIEYKTDHDNYIVVAFVYPDTDDKSYYYKTVGNRVEQCCRTEKEMRDFRACLTVAEIEFRRAQEE